MMKTNDRQRLGYKYEVNLSRKNILFNHQNVCMPTKIFVSLWSAKSSLEAGSQLAGQPSDKRGDRSKAAQRRIEVGQRNKQKGGEGRIEVGHRNKQKGGEGRNHDLPPHRL